MKAAYLQHGHMTEPVEFKKTEAVSRTGRTTPGQPRPMPTQLMVKHNSRWRRVYRPHGGSQRYIKDGKQTINVLIRSED